MFFPVTIYDSEGKVKKVLSSKKLHERHWKRFCEAESISSITKGRKREMRKGLKQKLDQEFPEVSSRHYQ
jgi:hypothetical protein